MKRVGEESDQENGAGTRRLGGGEMKLRFLSSSLIVICAGSLLHFAWEWSGRDAFVAIFAATNESTWEHLKLAFWPALLITPFQRAIYGTYPGWLPATAIRCLLPSFLIVAMFYGYTALLGGHHLAADLAIFALAIFAGEFLGHAALARRVGSKVRAAAAAVIVLATALFSTLTFRPPDFFLFRDPSSSHPAPYRHEDMRAIFRTARPHRHLKGRRERRTGESEQARPRKFT